MNPEVTSARNAGAGNGSTKTAKLNRQDIRGMILAGILAFLYIAAGLAGSSLERYGGLTVPDGKLIARCVTLWIFLAGMIWILWYALEHRKADRGQESIGWWNRPAVSRRLLIWLSLCLIDLISLLAVYPGFFVYDASEELAMVQSRAFTTHHPLLHVLLMGGIILAVHKLTSSWNAGIVIYILFQMMIINLAFTYLLEDIGRRRKKFAGGKKSSIVPGFLWLAFCPTVTMFVLCSCKDGLFSAALLVMTVQLRRMLMETDSFFAPGRAGRRQRSRYIAAASLMMLLRNNGVYAYVVFFVIFAAAFCIHTARHAGKKDGVEFTHKDGTFRSHEDRKRILLRSLMLTVFPILIYFAGSRGLAAATHAASGESQEILTVPIMQLGRTWQSDRDTFTEEEKELMAALVAPADADSAEETSEENGSVASEAAGSSASESASQTVSGIISESAQGEGPAGISDATAWDYYNPVLSDQLKLRFRSDVYRSRKSEFWRMYCRQLRLHPVTYLNAWLMTSYGFWYPEAVIDCYKGNTVYTFTYGDSSYFGWETEQPGERHSLIPILDGWYRFLSLDARAQRIPVLHLFLAPGALAWVFAFLLFYLAEQRQRRLLLVYLPTFLVWLTVLLGPCTLPRYVVYLWFEFPLIADEILTCGRNIRRTAAAG